MTYTLVSVNDEGFFEQESFDNEDEAKGYYHALKTAVLDYWDTPRSYPVGIIPRKWKDVEWIFDSVYSLLDSTVGFSGEAGQCPSKFEDVLWGAMDDGNDIEKAIIRCENVWGNKYYAPDPQFCSCVHVSFHRDDDELMLTAVPNLDWGRGFHLAYSDHILQFNDSEQSLGAVHKFFMVEHGSALKDAISGEDTPLDFQFWENVFEEYRDKLGEFVEKFIREREYRGAIHYTMSAEYTVRALSPLDAEDKIAKLFETEELPKTQFDHHHYVDSSWDAVSVEETAPTVSKKEQGGIHKDPENNNLPAPTSFAR